MASLEPTHTTSLQPWWVHRGVLGVVDRHTLYLQRQIMPTAPFEPLAEEIGHD